MLGDRTLEVGVSVGRSGHAGGRSGTQRAPTGASPTYLDRLCGELDELTRRYAKILDVSAIRNVDRTAADPA